MKARKKRFIVILVGLGALGLASWLVFNALGNNMSYFYSPTEVVQKKAPENHLFRLGGMVVKGSIQRGQELTVRFAVTDTANVVNVEYTGILPDLFDEEQGVIAQGKLNSMGVFIASEVLAKHDEKYMPPEVADALEKAGNMKTDVPAAELQNDS
ncbi:cytochrome c-type biogenesis protein CcmE [bacterium BMS3Bbin11]|nr:cytochrome c-type biogenesis protein CcmE [bacterium BMS3Abin11]GBE45438.1 cytochrome c-type biogenesis protein CcmE [bacterium BMS3Bbin11]GMT40636.1 MAG: cytochrome c-type biogenesis protein CcmE [bacterium]HDH08771.1 cytochrome c maturation protein CcmE [Gammaproteobacteria bacterium]HDH15461.1 cytochrome c maturation protein CcmE [Gammaproteobacteria bacterium]